MWKFTNVFFASFVSHSTNHSCFKCFNDIYVIYKFMCSFCFFQKKGLGNATHPGLSPTKRLRNFVKKTVRVWTPVKRRSKGIRPGGCSYPWLPFLALTQGFGQGRGEGCWDTMWMKKMGGVSEVHTQWEAAGGGKGGAKGEKGWGCC